MMIIPLLLSIIVTTSSSLPNNKEQETPICDAPVETLVDNEREGEASIDRSLETTDDALLRLSTQSSEKRLNLSQDIRWGLVHFAAAYKLAPLYQLT